MKYITKRPAEPSHAPEIIIFNDFTYLHNHYICIDNDKFTQRHIMNRLLLSIPAMLITGLSSMTTAAATNTGYDDNGVYVQGDSLAVQLTKAGTLPDVLDASLYKKPMFSQSLHNKSNGVSPYFWLTDVWSDKFITIFRGKCRK